MESAIPSSEGAPEVVHVSSPANQGSMSGILMKPTASSFVPKESGELDTKSSQEKASFNTDESGLVNEDTKLTITAENRLLAATAFENMGIDPRFIRALYEVMGFNRPSLIQAQAVPYILAQPRRHLIAQAQNGSGKTVCFSLGALCYVRENAPVHQVLILAHTRELILQINDVLTKLCTYTHIRTTCVLQGIHYDPTAQVVIGSVGAIKKAIMSGGFDYRSLVCMVIDEADEMIRNRAFAADIMALIKLFSGIRLPVQILLFSATFDEKVIRFAHMIAPGAVEIRKATTELQLSTVLLLAVVTPSDDAKCKALNTLYELMDVCQTCVFVNRRETADRLHAWLVQQGHKVGIIRGGDMDQKERMKVLKSFRNGETKVLITTDLLARGIDVLDVSLVVNFDIPMRDNHVDCETFLHRSGRTGRMGRRGVAVTFLEDEARDMESMKQIEQEFNMKVELVSLADKEVFEKKVNTWLK